MTRFSWIAAFCAKTLEKRCWKSTTCLELRLTKRLLWKERRRNSYPYAQVQRQTSGNGNLLTESFSPPSSQKMNTSSSPSNGCPCILIVTKTCRYWPSTVLLSYHMSCAAQLIHLIAVPLLLSPPASVRTPDAFRQPAASPLNFWFQNWSRWTKHCREAHQATCDVSNCVKGQALARKRKRGGVRGREVELVREEWDCTVPIQCLHTKDHWV